MEHKQYRQNKHNNNAQLSTIKVNIIIIVNKVMTGRTAGAETFMSNQEGSRHSPVWHDDMMFGENTERASFEQADCKHYVHRNLCAHKENKTIKCVIYIDS